MWKKPYILFFIYCFSGWALPPVGYSGEKIYQITETQLISLEQNLTRQTWLLSEAELELSRLSGKLKEVEESLRKSGEELMILEGDLSKSRDSLKTALESLEILERQVGTERLVWGAIGLGSGLLVGFIGGLLAR